LAELIIMIPFAVGWAFWFIIIIWLFMGNTAFLLVAPVVFVGGTFMIRGGRGWMGDATFGKAAVSFTPTEFEFTATTAVVVVVVVASTTMTTFDDMRRNRRKNRSS